MSAAMLRAMGQGFRPTEKLSFNKRTAAAASKGMRAIIEMHTSMELRELCEELGVDDYGMSHEERIDMIMKKECTSMQQYRRVLHAVWDAILHEQLRRMGKKLKLPSMDPRVLLLRVWTNDSKWQIRGFGPIYLPATTNRGDMHFWSIRDKDVPYEKSIKEGVSWYLSALEEKEKRAKRLEKNLKSNDYEAVLLFFTMVAELRELESEFRDWVLEKVFLARDEGFRQAQDCAEFQDEYHQLLAAHDDFVDDYVAESEQLRVMDNHYFELGADKSSRAASQEVLLMRLAQEAYQTECEILELREVLEDKFIEKEKLEMRLEEVTQGYSILHSGYGKRRKTCETFMGNQLNMAQQELSQQIKRLMAQQRAADRVKQLRREEIANLEMCIEECNMRYGKLADPPKKKKGFGVLKAAGKFKKKKKKKKKKKTVTDKLASSDVDIFDLSAIAKLKAKAKKAKGSVKKKKKKKKKKRAKGDATGGETTDGGDTTAVSDMEGGVGLASKKKRAKKKKKRGKRKGATGGETTDGGETTAMEGGDEDWTPNNMPPKKKKGTKNKGNQEDDDASGKAAGKKKRMTSKK